MVKFIHGCPLWVAFNTRQFWHKQAAGGPHPRRWNPQPFSSPCNNHIMAPRLLGGPIVASAFAPYVEQMLILDRKSVV